MPPKPKRITTAADKLYDLVKDKHEISFKDAAQELKVPIQTIEAWATFLEEDELLSIKYKLTTPYLILPTFDKKKAKGKEIKPLFQEKIADMEIKKEMNKGQAEHWGASQIVNLPPLAVLVRFQLSAPN